MKILEEMGFETDGHLSKFLTEDIAAEADLIFRATFEEIRSQLNRNSDRIPSSLSKRKRSSRLYPAPSTAGRVQYRGSYRILSCPSSYPWDEAPHGICCTAGYLYEPDGMKRT